MQKIGDLTSKISILGDEQASEALASGANDIVVVRQPNGELLATPVNLQIGQFDLEQKSNAQKTPF
jgi:phosphatidate phosphatase PAH1